jgi:flagellar hook-basal body complex protein FliE
MADPIAAISGSIRPVTPIALPAGGVQGAQGPQFAETLKGMIGEVEQAQRAAEDAARAYATGKSTDVTATMVSMERASITLALMLQVRNRLLEAYQEIQRIQV